MSVCCCATHDRKEFSSRLYGELNTRTVKLANVCKKMRCKAAMCSFAESEIHSRKWEDEKITLWETLELRLEDAGARD